jgi:UBX domain-containing protein 1/4
MTDTAENLTFLIDAGFSESAAKKALETNNNNVAEAMEWLLIHGENLKASETPQTGTTLKLSTPTATTTTTTTTSDEVEKTPDATDDASSVSANSLKCEDCGILLKDEDVATLHVRF